MEKVKIILNTIFALIGIVFGIVLYDTGKNMRDMRGEYERILDSLDVYREGIRLSGELIRVSDSLSAVEINKLRSDLVELSRLREMNQVQVKELQQEMRKEEARRDSIGSSLLDW